MERDRLRRLLEQVRAGELDPDGAVEALARMPFVDTPSASQAVPESWASISPS